MSGVELRETSGKLILEGHASTFDNWYSVGHFEEMVNRGAWKRCVNDPNLDAVLLVNHEGLPLSRTKSPSGPLSLSEDRRGLFVEAALDKRNPRTVELQSAAELGGLQMSVGMRVHQDNIIERNSGFSYSREITAASVSEVSAVTFGANAATDLAVTMRSGLTVDEERALRRGTIEHRPAPGGLIRSPASTCDRCGGPMEPRCDNCEPDGSTPVPIASVATDGRSALWGMPSMDSYREKALQISPTVFSRSEAERSIRRALADERAREDVANLERRKEWTSDWRAELQSAAAAKRRREKLYRSGR